MKCKVEAALDREVKKKLEEVTILKAEKARLRAMRSYENSSKTLGTM